MAKFRLNVMKAWSSGNGCVSIALDFKDYFPRREVECKTTAEALAALDAYAKEAEATGQSLVCFIDLMKRERSPNGFKKAVTKKYVNLRSEDEERATPAQAVDYGREIADRVAQEPSVVAANALKQG